MHIVFKSDKILSFIIKISRFLESLNWKMQINQLMIFRFDIFYAQQLRYSEFNINEFGFPKLINFLGTCIKVSKSIDCR